MFKERIAIFTMLWLFRILDAAEKMELWKFHEGIETIIFNYHIYSQGKAIKSGETPKHILSFPLQFVHMREHILLEEYALTRIDSHGVQHEGEILHQYVG
jgi:hypothetical protein